MESEKLRILKEKLEKMKKIFHKRQQRKKISQPGTFFAKKFSQLLQELREEKELQKLVEKMRSRETKPRAYFENRIRKPCNPYSENASELLFQERDFSIRRSFINGEVYEVVEISSDEEYLPPEYKPPDNFTQKEEETKNEAIPTVKS